MRKKKPYDESVSDGAVLLQNLVVLSLVRHFFKTAFRPIKWSYTNSKDSFGNSWEEDFYAWPGNQWERPETRLGRALQR
jgi:hypothetical protein